MIMKRKGLLSVLSGLAGIFVLARFHLLAGAPFLSGADAYYYALQVKYFVLTGALKIPDASPLMTLMGWTGRWGVPYESAVCLWMLLPQVLTALGLLLVHRLFRRNGQDWGKGALLVVWAILSPTLAFTGVEFPKYAFALAFLPWWILWLKDRRYWPVSLAAALFAGANHRALVGIAGVVLAGWVLQGGFGRLKGRKWLTWVALGVGGLGVLLLLARGHYFDPADLGRIQWAGLQPGIYTFLARPGIPAALKGEVLLSLAWVLGSLFVRLRRCGGLPASMRFWLPFIGFLFLPMGFREIMGLPERLTLALPLVVMSVEAGVVQAGEVACRWRWLTYSMAAVVLSAGIVFTADFQVLVHPSSLNPDYAMYRQVTEAVAPRKPPMLIAHLGLNYFYKYETMLESFPYEPEAHWPKDRIWRVVYGIRASEWAYYLPEDLTWDSGKLYMLPGPYSLVREDVWKIFREKVKVSGNGDLGERVFSLWLNPFQKRPGFVLRQHDREKEAGGEFSAFPAE